MVRQAIRTVSNRLSERFSNVFLVAVLFPIVVNAPALFDIVKADPAVFYSTVATNVRHGVFPGLPLIDPSIGFIFQSLGKRAAAELLSGHLPWWNPFEGVGVPLAGEMNVGAFFPLTLLLIFPRGQVFTQVIVQIVAGIGTLLFLRRLGLGRLAALTGAMLFEINGTMAWLASGWSYSQACLPFLLYGIELLRADERRTRLVGSIIVALAVALSIASGFIEVAYLNGLLAVGWSGLRFVQAPRPAKLAFGGALIGSGVVGAMLAAPVLIAFFDYLHVAYVGPHNGEAFSHAVLQSIGIVQKFMPYVFGPIFAFGPVATLWGSTGGYATLGGTVIALTTLGVRAQRSVRLYFLGWTVLTFGATFGLPLVHWFVLLWPGVRFTAQYRYFDSSWEFALCVLVAFAVSDVRVVAARTLLARIAIGTAIVVLLCCGSIVFSLPVMQAMWFAPGYRRWFVGSVLFAAAVVAGIAGALASSSVERRARWLAAVVIAEAIVCYMLPMLSYPTAATINLGGVDFLRRNIGLSRMYTMGPVFANYGTYFGVASINHNDIPMAQDWVSYVVKRLDPYVDPLLFLGTRPGAEVNVPSREDVLHENIANFKAIGVKYVLTFPQDRRLFESAYEPAVGKGEQSALPTLHAIVDVELPSLPPGTISGLEILQGNYRHTADGALHVRLCVAATCVTGQRRLAESDDNTYLVVPFDKPISSDGTAAAVRIEQRGGRHPDALWLWDQSPSAAESITVDGLPQPGKGARIRFTYSGQPVELPVLPGGNEAYEFGRGRQMSVHVADVARDGVIDGVGIVIGTNRHSADGTLQLRVCSGNDCARAERSLQSSPDDDFAWFVLSKKLRISGHDLSLSLVHGGGRTPAAVWFWPLPPNASEQATIDGKEISGRGPRVRLNYMGLQQNPARLVYRDETMNVYALSGYTPYFEAPQCTLDVASRTAVTADCRTESRLVRLELHMPGWSATVNGRAIPIEHSGELFEAVALPQGRSSVVFHFTPVFMQYGYGAFFIAVLVLVGEGLLLVVPRRIKRLGEPIGA